MKCSSTSEASKKTCILVIGAATLLFLALFLVGCDLPGSGSESTTDSAGNTTATTVPDATATTTPDTQVQSTTTAASNDAIALRVYFSRDEKMAAAARIVPMTLQTGAASVQALLEGPSAEEGEVGMFTAIPAGTEFLGLDIEDGVATVDLSQEYTSGGGSLSMFTRLAQVVFTLTQFPSVDGVRFKIDGQLITALGGEGIVVDEPITREDLEAMSPAILVESPTVGETVGSPMRVTGTANVFEAVFQINIVDWDGLIIAEQMVTATSGSGTRGTFDVTIPFTVSKAGIGALIVFAESPVDGSQIDVVEIPLKLVQ